MEKIFKDKDIAKTAEDFSCGLKLSAQYLDSQADPETSLSADRQVQDEVLLSKHQPDSFSNTHFYCVTITKVSDKPDLRST